MSKFVTDKINYSTIQRKLETLDFRTIYNYNGKMFNH